jgi:hypothetical protein
MSKHLVRGGIKITSIYQGKLIAFIKDYKIVKKILNYLEIYEIGKKRSPTRINTYPDEFDDYVRNDYMDCDFLD